MSKTGVMLLARGKSEQPKDILGKNTMVVGKQVKDCWGKNEGLGKMRMVSPFLFFPKILSFYIFSPAASFPLKGPGNITLIYNDQQKCAIY